MKNNSIKNYFILLIAILLLTIKRSSLPEELLHNLRRTIEERNKIPQPSQSITDMIQQDGLSGLKGPEQQGMEQRSNKSMQLFQNFFNNITYVTMYNHTPALIIFSFAYLIS